MYKKHRVVDRQFVIEDCRERQYLFSVSNNLRRIYTSATQKWEQIIVNYLM